MLAAALVSSLNCALQWIVILSLVIEINGDCMQERLRIADDGQLQLQDASADKAALEEQLSSKQAELGSTRLLVHDLHQSLTAARAAASKLIQVSCTHF